MKEITPKHLLDIAICAAEAAGNHAFKNKDRRTESNETFAHDVKLVLDIECQQVAEAVILNEFPDHAILGEEGSHPAEQTDYEWIIDPIDGTMNFSHGMHYWCTSIAVRQKNEVLAGCVYAPEFNQFYTAHIDSEAQLNGAPIHAAETALLQQAMVFSGLSKYMEDSGELNLEMFRTLALNTKKIRINGAAALDICRVADGTADGVLHMGIHLWDYAAASLIAEKSGAELKVYRQNNEEQDCNVIVTNKHLSEGLRNLYTQHI